MVVDTSLAISYLSDSLYFVIVVGWACQGSERFIGKCNGTLRLIHITHPILLDFWILVLSPCTFKEAYAFSNHYSSVFLKLWYMVQEQDLVLSQNSFWFDSCLYVLLMMRYVEITKDLTIQNRIKSP